MAFCSLEESIRNPMPRTTIEILWIIFSFQWQNLEIFIYSILKN